MRKCCFGYGPYSSSGGTAIALALLQFCCVQMGTHSFGWCVHRLCDVDIVLACAFVLMFTTSLMTVFMTLGGVLLSYLYFTVSLEHFSTTLSGH